MKFRHVIFNSAGDWFPKTVSRDQFGYCGYEAEIGTSIKSSQIILSNLFNWNWINQKTNLLFFEQTFLNPNLNSISQLRVSFERTPGGGFQAQIRINQLEEEF